MSQILRTIPTDLAVVGSGLAGFSASIFALNRGIKTAQAGNTGAVAYTTGYLDLLGAVGADQTDFLDTPWSGIEWLKQHQPQHPLARIAVNDIQEAFKQVTSFLSESGIAYDPPGDRNQTAITPIGTSKPTFSVPLTMAAGVAAYKSRASCVIVDFKGLRGFSAKQVVANLSHDWPLLRAERVTFPDMFAGEIYPEVMARALEVEATQQKLAEALKEVAGDAEVIGMPAIMGMHNPDQVMEQLSRLVGKQLFEIPTMPPSVPGIRLREMFEQVFPEKGLTLIPQQKVTSLEFRDDHIALALSDNYGPITIEAKTVILASGRFLSGGLEADINGISEPLLDLAVTQPSTRNDWYRNDYMDQQGHEIHKCGIEVDAKFRPLDRAGKVVDKRLFAAGIILAHQDWIRDRCGAGVAIATAYKAVEAAEKTLL